MGEIDWELAMAARSYLRQVRDLEDEIRSRKRQRVEISQAVAALGSPSYDSEPVQTSKSPDAPFTRLVEKLIDLDKRTAELIEEREAVRNLILSQIDQMKDNRFKILLRARYAHCERFEAVACELNYSLRQTLRLHKRALAAFGSQYKDVIESHNAHVI